MDPGHLGSSRSSTGESRPRAAGFQDSHSLHLSLSRPLPLYVETGLHVSPLDKAPWGASALSQSLCSIPRTGPAAGTGPLPVNVAHAPLPSAQLSTGAWRPGPARAGLSDLPFLANRTSLDKAASPGLCDPHGVDHCQADSAQGWDPGLLHCTL